MGQQERRGVAKMMVLDERIGMYRVGNVERYRESRRFANWGQMSSKNGRRKRLALMIDRPLENRGIACC